MSRNGSSEAYTHPLRLHSSQLCVRKIQGWLRGAGGDGLKVDYPDVPLYAAEIPSKEIA